MPPIRTLRFRNDEDDGISEITKPKSLRKVTTPKRKKTFTEKSGEKRLSEKEFNRRKKELMAVRKEPWFKKSLNKVKAAMEKGEAECSKCQSCEKAMLNYFLAKNDHDTKISQVYDEMYPMG